MSRVKQQQFSQIIQGFMLTESQSVQYINPQPQLINHQFNQQKQLIGLVFYYDVEQLKLQLINAGFKSASQVITSIKWQANATFTMQNKYHLPFDNISSSDPSEKSALYLSNEVISHE